MLDLWQETGPLAYAIIPFGAISLLFAILYLRSGERTSFVVTVGTTVTTLLLGVMAFVTGAHRAMSSLGMLEPDDRWIVALGINESFSCFIFSLVFAVVSSILLTVGAYRTAAGRQSATVAVSA